MSRRFPWQLVAVFLLLAAGLFTLSRFFYGLQVRHARVYKESELATMAGLMSTRLAEWRAGKIAFAEAISDNPGNARRTEDFIKDQGSAEARKAYLDSLAAMQKNLSFSWAALVLAGGKIVLSYPEDAAVSSTPESARLEHGAWQDREAQLGTVYVDPATGRRSVEMMIPLVSYDGQAPRPLALLRISYDASVSIDPILDDWPNSGPAAEAILLEREGSDFIHLNRPRLHSGATPPGPLPISRLRRPASQEALGEEGIVEGRDYRGRNVIAFIKAVREAPWFVAVKTDAAVLTSGMMGSYLTLTGLAAAFVALCGVLLYLFWRRTLSAQEAAERSKWDQANANLNEFMQLMIDIMPNPAFFKDTDGVYIGTNSAFEKLLGLNKDEVVGKTIADVAPEDIVKQHEERDKSLLAKPGHQVYEAPLQAWDGEHHVIFIKSTYKCPDGTLGGIIGILKDITQRLRSEEELEQLRRFSESTVQTMTEGLVLTDSDGKFTFVNPAAALMMGRTPSEMVGQEVLSFVPKDQHSLVRRADEKRTKGISDRYELVFLHKDGSRRTFLVSGGPRVQGANFGGTMAVLTDITDRKHMEEEIRALSLRDELTTLYNRRGFMTLAEQQLKTASRMKKSIALLYLDVDNLKRINDTGGHKLGDRALVEIAFILKKSFRESDIVGRLGGDEFAVLAMETTKMNVEALTTRLRDKLEGFNSRSSAEVGFELSVSVGVFSREPDLPATVEEMLSRADLLMYEQKRAKKAGEPAKPPGPSK